jgi:hypothetical protein
MNMGKNISYSLFGTLPKYYVGAIKNVKLNKKLIPEWETIIYYHPNNFDFSYLPKLEKLGAKMINVKDIQIGGKPSIDFPYFWRFLSFLNEGPTIVRDLDSRVSKREVKYINNWLNSNLEYFIIRDHPWHSPVPSGLFGIKSYVLEFENHFNNFISKSDLRWGTDQEILHEYMEPLSKNNIFYCGYDKEDNYIKRNNKNFFIGMQIDENDNPIEPSAIMALNYLKELGY